MAKAKSPVSFKNRLETTFKTMPSETLRVGFSDIDKWVGMGNFAMNRMNSGRFDVAWMYGRNYILYGESGSGKSLMAALIAAEAQRKDGALVVWVDVEKATDDEAGKRWLARTGMDMDNLVYVSAAGLEEIKRLIAELAGELRDNFRVEGGDPVQPVVLVIDSWAAALPKTALERVKSGELVGDQGQKAKQTGDVILSTTHLSSGVPLLVIGIQHIMDNQEGFGRKHKTTGGNKMLYFASGCMLYTKQELRMEDVENPEHLAELKKVTENWSANLKKEIGIKHKDGEVVGITIVVENLKNRVSKPFTKIEVQVPYKFGVDPYGGLFELLMMEQAIFLVSAGRYGYTDPDVEADKDGKRVVTFYKKEFLKHADRIMQLQPADISNPDDMRKAAEPVVLPENVEALVETVKEAANDVVKRARAKKAKLAAEGEAQA
jgi:RecA/RadA recombinase